MALCTKFVAVWLLLYFRIQVEQAQSTGCHTNSWECQENWYCSESQKRCQPCSKIAQFYCSNWTTIVLKFKECAAFCQELKLAEAEAKLQNKSMKLAETELQLAETQQLLQNKSKEMEKMTIEQTQAEENWRNMYKRDVILISIVALVCGGVVLALVWFLIRIKRRGSERSNPEAPENIEMGQSLLGTITQDRVSEATAPPSEEGYETDSSEPQAASPIQCHDSNFVTMPTQDDSASPAIFHDISQN